MPPGAPFLAAVLIARDEESNIQRCIESVRPLVDEVLVHDTGSQDNTVELAHNAGARVSVGDWNDDFAQARNQAASQTAAEWILSIDADETVEGSRPVLRQLLGEAKFDAFKIDIAVEHEETPYTFQATRVFRRQATHWVGRVHEQVAASTGELHLGELPASTVLITHSGYETRELRILRAERNATIARQTIEMVSDERQLARAYVDLGRSLMVMGNAQDAADAYEEVRSRFVGTAEWVKATDFLTRLVLAEGMYPETLALVQQLSERGVSDAYCDWLAAQALVQLGRFEEANALLNNVEKVVDTSGRRHSDETLQELKGIVARLAEINSPG